MTHCLFSFFSPRRDPDCFAQDLMTGEVFPLSSEHLGEVGTAYFFLIQSGFPLKSIAFFLFPSWCDITFTNSFRVLCFFKDRL